MDVAVIGAGPAGAWAAYRLARRGARVTIFDPSHPREKPCGGGVTGRALAIVESAIDRAALPAVAVRAARFTDTARGADAVVPLDGSALVVACRAAFDRALLDAAVGAGAVLCASRVTDVRPDRAGASIDARGRSWRAGFVIGADGANSIVRRRMAEPFRRGQLSMATGFFARGVSSGEIVVELTADPPGYIWSFPRPDHLAVGVCAQADAGATAGALRERVRNWIAASRIAPSAALDAYSWPIPSLTSKDFGRLSVAGPRWCLAGDAAGLVDPITREGIFYALESGGWAAEALAAPGGDAAARYTARVHDEAAGELRRAARLKAGFFRPAFARLMVRALQESGPVRAVMADLVAGEQPYRTLRWRLLQTLELGLAWRSYFAK